MNEECGLSPYETREILFYKTDNGDVRVEILLYQENLWLTQAKMAELFEAQKAAISKHLKNIFNSGELLEESVVSKMETTAADGKRYNTNYYNLDAIIAVGYRVNSRKAQGWLKRYHFFFGARRRQQPVFRLPRTACLPHNFRKHLADTALHRKRRAAVHGRHSPVDQHQLIAPVIVDQPRRRVNGQRSAAHDQHLRLTDVGDRLLQRRLIQPLLIEHHIRLNDTAAVTFRHAVLSHDSRKVIKFPAARTVIPVHGAMKLQHLPAPRRLVQPVNILGDHRPQLPPALKLR